jgi:pimeloyl-ACP methyl ester carboxylesterase
MPYASVNGVSLHYWQVGEGPDLVMLHGLGGNLAVWHFAITAQLRHLYRITTYDLRGHGRSDMSATGYTTRNMAHDLAGLLDALRIRQAHLWGHSFGADIALHFTLLHPQRVTRLVVIDAMLPVMLRQYKRDDWAGWAYWAQMLEKVAGVRVPREKWQDITYMMNLSLEVPVLFGPFRGRPRNRVPITRLLTETTIVQDFDAVDEMTLENLARISPPTLLMYEKSSPFLETYEVLRQRLPHATSALLADSELRHFSPLEQPELILEYARAFLQPDMALSVGVGEQVQR